jgi:phosphoribosylaminoimidazole carboxylase PurE protein
MKMAEKKAIVGVVMGSQSDLEIMQGCVEQLEEFGIPYEVRVISAHRTPDVAHEYAATACERGVKVIIAAAGMSAALAGVLASETTLPIVGVPINSGPLNGVDALLSTMQMPPGVPVGCMAVGKAGAKNSAIYAAQILATGDAELSAKLREFKTKQANKVKETDARVSRKP